MKKISLTLLSVVGVTLFSSVFVEAETITVTGENQATVPVTGTIKEFDPENPDEGEEENPNIPDEQWIKVDIPSAVSFAASEASKGSIASATYTIKNRSAEGVKVSAESFSSVGEEDNLFSGTELNLVSGDKQVPLRTKANDFLSQRTELMNLSGSIIDGQPTEVQEEATFKLTGQLGDDFDFKNLQETSIQQEYSLVFHFERVKD